MKRLGVLAVFLGLALAQTWYYKVDEDPFLTPSKLTFTPTAEQQACAAIQNPAPGPGPLRVNLTSLAQSCPGPPVVVWGTHQGKTYYAVLLTVKFWGEGRIEDPDTGVEALIQVIERGYNFRLEAKGALNKVGAQYRPPFTTPPIVAPVNAPTGWTAWRARQDLPLGRPLVHDETQYDSAQTSPYCAPLYATNTCWSARLTWALPVRLVLRGGETGTHQIRIQPAKKRPFREKPTAATLGVRRGRLTRAVPRVLPGDAAKEPAP